MSDKYDRRAADIDSLVCVGLDADIDRLPVRFQASETPQYDFNRWIIEQTHPYASAYKLNTAFYEAHGAAGWRDMAQTMTYLRENHPAIFTICDAKRADIGNTNRGYARAVFDDLGFDAITIHPYLGGEALTPFLERQDKYVIVLCRTSNPTSGEFQDLKLGDKPLWQIVAEHVHNDWNSNGNCMLVVGATYPAELKQVRALTGQMTLLVPGVGTQGGDPATIMHSGLNAAGRGLIVNSSRGVIFSDDPAQAARTLRDTLNAAR
jgi:orotidine-5'-phosphate decarboxylase